MVRPRKCRRVCKMPERDTFGPLGKQPTENDTLVLMSVEGYEVIRLLDYEKLTQEETADLMGVARSTIQRIYDEARKAMAESLVTGRILKIQGGNYRLCGEYNEFETVGPCMRRRCCERNKAASKSNT